MEIFRNLFTSSQGLFWGVAGILGITLLIFIHECGHFIMCKIFGVRTPSFSIGFGPKLISKKIGQTEFSISAIPFGGYVEIAGSAEVGQGEQKEAFAQDEGSFAVRPFYQKFLIMSGGILFNLLFAYLVMVCVFACGLPKSEFLYPLNAIPKVETIENGSPADKAGLKTGDLIIAANETPLNNDTEKLLGILRDNGGKTISFLIERNGEQTLFNVPLETKSAFGKNIGYLGTSFAMVTVQGIPFIKAIQRGIELTNRYIVATVYMFKYIFAKRDMSNVGGPVMIIKATAQGASKGLKVFLLFLAIISINLAILNLIPLPIFDGGQIMIYGIEAIIGKSLPDKARLAINLTSWGLIMFLFIYVTIKDIWRIIAQYIPK
ncbi:MAG TPA: site-2 protease family protein [Candidatus Dependentiae bacterium]|nr:site-2 protease family protein [Candidatus Dependentiae bacterium]